METTAGVYIQLQKLGILAFRPFFLLLTLLNYQCNAKFKPFEHAFPIDDTDFLLLCYSSFLDCTTSFKSTVSSCWCPVPSILLWPLLAYTSFHPKSSSPKNSSCRNHLLLVPKDVFIGSPIPGSWWGGNENWRWPLSAEFVGKFEVQEFPCVSYWETQENATHITLFLATLSCEYVWENSQQESQPSAVRSLQICLQKLESTYFFLMNSKPRCVAENRHFFAIAINFQYTKTWSGLLTRV